MVSYQGGKLKKFLLFGLIVVLFSCQSLDDSLDSVKSYHPDDPYFKSSLVSLHFVTETQSIEDVDKNFNNILKTYDLPTNAEGCADGEFTGKSPYDAYDYKHVVKLVVKDEKIISANYDEIHKDGHGKRENEKYCEEMSVTGTTPAIAYPIYEKELLEKQIYSNIDAVSGATYSLYRFRYTVMVALMKAKLENSK